MKIGTPKFLQQKEKAVKRGFTTLLIKHGGNKFYWYVNKFDLIKNEIKEENVFMSFDKKEESEITYTDLMKL